MHCIWKHSKALQVLSGLAGDLMAEETSAGYEEPCGTLFILFVAFDLVRQSGLNMKQGIGYLVLVLIPVFPLISLHGLWQVTLTLWPFDFLPEELA